MLSRGMYLKPRARHPRCPPLSYRALLVRSREGGQGLGRGTQGLGRLLSLAAWSRHTPGQRTESNQENTQAYAKGILARRVGALSIAKAKVQRQRSLDVRFHFLLGRGRCRF